MACVMTTQHTEIKSGLRRRETEDRFHKLRTERRNRNDAARVHCTRYRNADEGGIFQDRLQTPRNILEPKIKVILSADDGHHTILTFSISNIDVAEIHIVMRSQLRPVKVTLGIILQKG